MGSEMCIRDSPVGAQADKIAAIAKQLVFENFMAGSHAFEFIILAIMSHVENLATSAMRAKPITVLLREI